MRTIIGSYQADLFFNYDIPWDNTSAWRAEYHKYLRSSVWKVKAELAKFLAGYHCTARLPGCLGDKRLQAHHVHYGKPFGDEIPDEDVVCLCANCHRNIHAKPIIEPDAANDNIPDVRRKTG